MHAIHNLSAGALLAALRAGELSVAELTQTYLDRMARYDGRDGLNAVAQPDTTAMDQARALDADPGLRGLPLFGLPVLFKDNIDVRGLHTTAGSLALTDNLARDDAPVAAALRRAGAVVLGKTNMTELANYATQGMPGGYSSRGGQVRCVYGGSPGGSSSGSGVAVSAGLCAAALGTDTSFSVVACAATNGVVGLKPPHGVLPQEGIVPIAHTLDSAGPMTRTLSDALLIYSVMRPAPMPPAAPAQVEGLRIAVNTFDREIVSEGQLAAYERLFASLRADGARIEEVSHPYSPQMKDIMRCEFRHDLEGYLAASAASVKTLPDLLARYREDPERMLRYGCTCLSDALDNASGRMDDPLYIQAMAERERLRAWLLAELDRFDACVMTGPTNIMHMTGLPSLSLPLCMGDTGRPRGIIMYGADESRLWSAALAIERYCRAPVCKLE